MTKTETKQMTKTEGKTLADWPKMDWTYQDEEFFSNVRKLHNSGLNPRKQLTTEHVTQEDVFSLFGQKGCRLTSPHLPQSDKLGLLNIYWRVFGSEEVTNNEVQGWIVKGYIAEKKKTEINWARAAAMTAVEMARRKKCDINQKVDARQGDDSKGSFLSHSEQHFVSTLSGKAGGPNSSTVERVKSESNVLGYHPSLSKTVSAEHIATCQYPSHFSLVGVCPFLVSTDDIAHVEELISLTSEIWKITKTEITVLERKRKINQDKLLGLKFSTQDRNVVFAEQAKDLEEKNQELDAKKKSRVLLSIELEILQGKVDAAENADEKATPLKLLHDMQDKLEDLDSDLDIMMRNVDIANSLCDNLRKIAYQGEQVLANTQSEDHDLEDAILQATMQVNKFSVQHEALSNQAAEMRLGGGMSLWPKPILHPAVPELVLDSSRHVLHVMPCACCKRWYNCNDVFFTSCRHCYHPACLIEYLKTHTTCLVCNERLHPDWWSSWGIRELDDDLKQLACDLDLEAKRIDTIQALKNSMKSHSTGVANEISIETTQLQTEVGSTSAFKSVRGRHSLGVADSKDFVSPSSYHLNRKDEFFFHVSPNQSRHKAVSHSPTTDFTRAECNNGEVDSPYKSCMMQKRLLESDVDVEELGICKFRQPFHQASKIPSSTADGFDQVSCENVKSDSLEGCFEDKTGKETIEIPAVLTDSGSNLHPELQHLVHGDGDEDCQNQSLEKTSPTQNKRSDIATIEESSIKKLKLSSKNGPDDVHEPRKVIALQDLTDAKVKKGSSKWAPTTKKPAKSWGVSAQGMACTLRSRDCKSSD